jgi:hypothetical protein
VNNRPPIEIKKQFTLNTHIHFNELSVGIVYKTFIQNILNHKVEDINTFLISNTETIIQGLCIKSIGDWGQELTSIAKYGAYSGNNLNEYKDMLIRQGVIPYDETGNALRLGVANDRPSAFRMIYMRLFANPDSMNAEASVGYKSKTVTFIVNPPPVVIKRSFADMKSDLPFTPRKRGGKTRKPKRARRKGRLSKKRNKVVRK